MNYLIYDSALNGTYTLMMLQKHYPNHQSLFKKTKDEMLNDVAPYLFLVDDNGEKLKEEIEISLKETMVVQSFQPLDILADHFREFIYQKVNGRVCYFRFWDARVLKKFLPMCTEMQLRLFFRPVSNIIMADEIPGEVLQYSVQYSKLYISKGLSKGMFPVIEAVADMAVTT
jgi:hypothetical protein